MKTKLRILVAGRSKEGISDLQEHLSEHERFDVQLRHIVNGHADPLYGIPDLPDLLVLHINGLEGGELTALLERPVSVRPPMVVISGTDDASAMRQAMKAGARDFLLQSQATELVQSVNAMCDELQQQTTPDGRLTAVVNSKGGAGATFLACNIAHLAVSVTDEPTALIGLDMQFPTLPAYFDLKLKHGLLDAIQSADELDATALEAIMATHKSGLKLLAARPQDFRFSFENLVAQTDAFLDLLLAQYRHVVIDMPRRMDEYNAQVISRASQIVMVVQQSLPHVQDATRLQQLLRDQLGISSDRLLVVVNRFNKRGEIQLADIESALPGAEILTVPNHYKDVSESINLGIPMYEYSRSSAVTRAVATLQSRLCGHTKEGDAAAESGRLSSLIQRSPLQQFFGGD